MRGFSGLSSTTPSRSNSVASPPSATDQRARRHLHPGEVPDVAARRPEARQGHRIRHDAGHPRREGTPLQAQRETAPAARPAPQIGPFHPDSAPIARERSPRT